MQYPAQMDLPDEYVVALGSFWSDKERDPLLRNLITARLLHDRHALNLLDDYRNSFSRQKCPLLQRQEAILVRLRENDRSTTDSMYRFGDTNLVFDGTKNYGQVNKEVFSWSTPDGLLDVAFIVDRLEDSTVSWTGSVDYRITDGKLVFVENPFGKPNVPINEVIDEATGEVINREIWLWLWGCRFEKDYLYRFFGYAVGMPLPSTENAKTAVNAVYDGITRTCTADTVTRMVGAIADAGFAVADGEVVEYVHYDANGLVVVTDRQAYRGPLAATALVAAGDTINKNDPLTDAAIVHSLHRGILPAETPFLSIPFLAIQPEWLDIEVSQPMVVNNDATGLRAIPNTDTGFLEIEFDLAEHDEEFWEEVRRREVAQGISLAKVTLGLTADDDEPVAAQFPTTIKPLQWLVTNFLRNAILIVIETNSRGSRSLPLSALSRLSYASAPHIWYITLIISELRMDDYEPAPLEGDVIDLISGDLEWTPSTPTVAIENTGETCQ